jgi:hypothetical protein
MMRGALLFLLLHVAISAPVFPPGVAEEMRTVCGAWPLQATRSPATTPPAELPSAPLLL